MNKKNMWKKYIFGAGIITIILMASPLTAAHVVMASPLTTANVETNSSNCWELIPDIFPDENEPRPFHEGDIEFWVLIKNIGDCSTPPIHYEAWVERGISGGPYVGSLDSGDIDFLCSGCKFEKGGLYWYFNDPGFFRVCVKVTAGNEVPLQNCFTFLVLPHGFISEPIPQDLSEVI